MGHSLSLEPGPFKLGLGACHCPITKQSLAVGDPDRTCPCHLPPQSFPMCPQHRPDSYAHSCPSCPFSLLSASLISAAPVRSPFLSSSFLLLHMSFQKSSLTIKFQPGHHALVIKVYPLYLVWPKTQAFSGQEMQPHWHSPVSAPTSFLPVPTLAHHRCWSETRLSKSQKQRYNYDTCNIFLWITIICF